MSSQRVAHLQRETSESSIDLSLDLDGTGVSDIHTSVPFYDHLLTAFSKHSLIDLRVRASGDTEIDVHHTVEDIGIVLGRAIKDALGDKAGITRYGDALVPLDEALVQAVVDVSGRPYLVHTVHITVLGGRDPHHIAEAEFKAFARALRTAVEPDARVTGIPSTKGAL
jgi:imidazoleglycerol-phosphate dehydratase